MLDRSSLLKPKLAWWWMDEVPCWNDRRSSAWILHFRYELTLTLTLNGENIEIRRKVVENRTVVEQGIKISWHPHPTIYPWLRWVSVRVREHQHEERAPSGVVSWTVTDRQKYTGSTVKEWVRETEVKRWIDKAAKSFSKYMRTDG